MLRNRAGSGAARFALLLLAVALLPGFRWEDVTPSPVYHGASAASGVRGGQLIHLAAGGWWPSDLANFDDHSVYDAAADTWVSRRELPLPLLWPAGAVVGDRFFVFGGGDLSLAGFLNVWVYEYDPGSDTWTEIRRDAMPAPAVGLRAAVLNGQVHVVGGTDYFVGTFTRAHRVFNPGTEQWSTAADLPVPTTMGALVAAEGKLYYIGGFLDDAFTPTDQVHVYDPSSGIWSPGARLPVARGDLNGVLFEGKIVVAGGWDGGQPAVTYDRVDIYDPVAGSWEDGPPLGCPREGGTVAVASDGGGDRVYVLEGTQNGWASGPSCNAAEASAPEDTTPPDFAGLESAQDTTLCPDVFVPEVTLSWSPGSDADSPPVTYVVYRNADPGFTPAPGDIIDQDLTDADVPYLDRGVSCGESWTYIVEARDALGNESTTGVRMTVDLPCTPPPPPPPIVRELRVLYTWETDHARVTLSWPDFSPPLEVTHYHVYRAADASLDHGDWEVLAPPPVASPFWDEDPAGGILFYDVRTAIDCLDTESDE